MRQIGGWQTDGPISFYWEGRGPKVRPCQYRSTKVFGLATLLLLTTAGGSHVAGASPPATALPPFPGVAEAVAQFDRLDAPGVTKMQRRLIVFEGALAVGRLPCTGEQRADSSRGVTIGWIASVNVVEITV